MTSAVGVAASRISEPEDTAHAFAATTVAALALVARVPADASVQPHFGTEPVRASSRSTTSCSTAYVYDDDSVELSIGTGLRRRAIAT